MGGTVVVGYDGKEPAKRALGHAIAEAKATGERLVIAVAWAMPLDPIGPKGSLGFDLTAPLPDVQPLAEPAALKPIVDEALARAAAAGVSAESVYGVGDPARTIVDAARDHQASKIVIGHDHTPGSGSCSATTSRPRSSARPAATWSWSTDRARQRPR